MLQGEHSAILSTLIKLPFVIKIFVLSVFEWPFNTGFTVSSLFIDKNICCRYSLEVSPGAPTTYVFLEKFKN